MVYRITYPFLPVIARGLGVDLTSAGLLVTAARAAGLSARPLAHFLMRGGASG